MESLDPTPTRQGERNRAFDSRAVVGCVARRDGPRQGDGRADARFDRVEAHRDRQAVAGGARVVQERVAHDVCRVADGWLHVVEVRGVVPAKVRPWHRRVLDPRDERQDVAKLAATDELAIEGMPGRRGADPGDEDDVFDLEGPDAKVQRDLRELRDEDAVRDVCPASL